METGEIVADILLRLAYVLLALSVGSAVFFVLRSLCRNIIETVIVFAFLLLCYTIGGLVGSAGIMIAGVILTYVWLVITSILQKNQGAYTSLAGVAVLLITFLICYAVAGDEVTERYASFDITPAISKFIGGMINTVIVLIFLAVGTGFIASIYTALKR